MLSDKFIILLLLGLQTLTVAAQEIEEKDQREEYNLTQSLTIWKEWSRLTEEHFFRAYHQTKDAWLREHVPSIPPLRVEEGDTRLTSDYGYRRHPITKQYRFHNGLDLSGNPGQAVYATAQGLVKQFGDHPYLGQYVVLSHAGVYETWYGHLSKVLVQPGQWVAREMIIGLVGKSGRASGYHLHYIIKRNGKIVNANPYLFLRYRL